MTATAGLAIAARYQGRGVDYIMVFYRILARCLLVIGVFLAAQASFAQAIASPTVPATPAAPDIENTLYLDLSTGGRVTILLNPAIAPAHVERIKTLARKGFYNGLVFHRVIEGFMAQTGDPTGTGQGNSDLPDLKAEFNPTPHLRGTVSMARTNEPDSANSQFFICFQPRFSLDKKYTVFGRVTSGMQYVDAIARGEPPATPDKIVKASIAADVK
jgi:cyclophilin family peptidyl-prolyl cis-trans isomerase